MRTTYRFIGASILFGLVGLIAYGWPAAAQIVTQTVCSPVTGTGGCVGQASPTFTGVVAFANGSASAPAIAFTGSAATGVTYGGSNNLSFPLGGSSTALVMDSSSGNPYLGGATGGQFVFFQSNGDLKLQPHAGNALIFTAIGTDATHTDATICRDTTSGSILTGTGTAGICLGTSSARFKHNIAPLSVGLNQIMALQPVSYRLNPDHGDASRTYYGFTAEQGGKVLPILMGTDKTGRPNTFDYMGIVPVLVKALQDQQHQLLTANARIAALEGRLKK